MKKPNTRNRNPITLRGDLHLVVKANAKKRGMTLESFSDEIFTAGLKVKRIALSPKVSDNNLAHS